MGMKTNFALSIIALVIAVIGCAVAVRLFSTQPTSLTEDRISALIEEKTKPYITEDEVKKIIEERVGRLEESISEKEELEQRIRNLEIERKKVDEISKKLEKVEVRGKEIDQLRNELERVEQEVQQLKRIEGFAIKEKELNQRIAKLEEKSGEIEQLLKELDKRTRPPKVVVKKELYRISLFRSSVNPEYPLHAQYIMVLVDGKEILKTYATRKHEGKWWGDYRKEIVVQKTVQNGEVLSVSKIEVFLMDKTLGKDKVLGHWVVNDPFKLGKLSKDGNSIEFIVEKIEGKLARILKKGLENERKTNFMQDN